MTKQELMDKAEQLQLVDSELVYDFAIPINWVRGLQQELKGLIEDEILNNIPAHFVWQYPKRRPDGPLPLSKGGVRLLMLCNEKLQANYEIPGVDLMTEVMACEMRDQRKRVKYALNKYQHLIEEHAEIIKINNPDQYDHMMKTYERLQTCIKTMA